MTRIEFTKRIVRLLDMMIQEGERPIIDYVKRSRTEQLRMYELGLSKCDGTNKRSQHQFGKAMDIYFVQDNGKDIGEPIKGDKYWHDKWEELGGEQVIGWDMGHYEVK